MKTRTLRTSTSLIPVVGLLVLAGVFSDAPPALAQTQEVCPLPDGVAPLADPRVTAQQVEDGSASLMDFTLAAREQLRNLTVEITTTEGLAYFGCLVRQEGGPWRSGSTYTAFMSLEGRLVIHTKDVTLVGRQLDPFIYAEILSVLGVSTTDLFNLVSPDPDTASLAFAAVLNTLSQEPDGPFDATNPILGLRPGIPGVSGYAAVHTSANHPTPIVLLVGFDINESHLTEEDLDYGDPAITAEDVVDRETLKAFVEEAEKYFLTLQETGDPNAVLKARLAMRDPNGPWRHGNVYLYIVDRISNLIVFHGAFPNQFEFRPPGVSRDAVTGELIRDQIFAAAASSSEGGFWNYHFDDPTDDTDSAEIPKVGYARESIVESQRSDGIVFTANFIVGSGFYRNAADALSIVTRTEVEATVLGDAVEGLTVEFSRAIVGHQPDYAWSAVTDATGHASLTILSDRRVSGYYRAQALNDAGEVVGQWHGIPLNRDRRQVLELSLDGGVSIVRVESLAAAKAVAATSDLAPNAPNPFNSATQIAYHLSSPGPVQLVIYNMLGQPVRTLVDQFQAAGSYQVQWDARDQRGVSLSSGVYTTRLSYPGGVQTQRLLYLK